MSPTANIHYPGEVIERTELSLEWSDMRNMTYHERVVRPRSKGVHVSGIIKEIARRRKLYKPGDELDDMPTVVLLGQAFEEQAARLYPDMVWQPGEVKRDGVVGSPDGRDLLQIDHQEYGRTREWTLDEFKLTYKSNRNRQDIRAEQTWMMQVMSYLWMDESTYRGKDYRFYTRIHVMWCCDNYVMPFRPVYIRYLVRFTEAELKRNWDLMMKFKQFAVAE